ncbi:hypothetical protein CAPGI0001_0168 [Capnocytophaga gingivalis ATCC 33624]|nr:hypothetical protein CAPGI0001_0168 [Capnocytophaga gingivalis ATCC 33624]
MLFNFLFLTFLCIFVLLKNTLFSPKENSYPFRGYFLLLEIIK